MRAKVLATALAHPQEFGLPFASWTIERLHTYLHEQGIWMGKTRMFEIWQEEGLRWYKQEGWFGERVDPQFAEQRGPSSAYAPLPPTRARSSTWMRWDRSKCEAMRGSKPFPLLPVRLSGRPTNEDAMKRIRRRGRNGGTSLGRCGRRRVPVGPRAIHRGTKRTFSIFSVSWTRRYLPRLTASTLGWIT